MEINNSLDDFPSFVAGTISSNVAVIAAIMKYNFNKLQHCYHDLSSSITND